MKKHIPILILSAIFVTYSFYKHYHILSWDFCAYVLNSNYLFGDGFYFEPYRPPLMPVILAFTGEHLYILIASTIFIAGTLILANTLYPRLHVPVARHQWRFLYLLFALSTFTIGMAFKAGPEPLVLGLLQLFLSQTIKLRLNAQYLALAILGRYDAFLLAPLLLIQRKPKNVLWNILIFGGLMAPWLLFNWWEYGHPAASLLDSYALNIKFRQYMMQPLTLDPFQEVLGLWPLVWIGLGLILSCHTALRISGVIWRAERIIPLLFLFFAAILIYHFSGIPHKQPRYLFNLAIPAAFFGAFGAAWIFEYHRKLMYLLLICTLANVYNDNQKFQTNIHFDQPFYKAAQAIQDLDLSDCEILSPHWVPMHYLSGNVYPLKTVGLRAQPTGLPTDKIVLIFTRKNYLTRDDKFTLDEIKNYPTIYQGHKFVLLGNSDPCTPKPLFNYPYIRDHNIVVPKSLRKFSEFLTFGRRWKGFSRSGL